MAAIRANLDAVWVARLATLDGKQSAFDSYLLCPKRKRLLFRN
jgi:hypothetical protein